MPFGQAPDRGSAPQLLTAHQKERALRMKGLRVLLRRVQQQDELWATVVGIKDEWFVYIPEGSDEACQEVWRNVSVKRIADDQFEKFARILDATDVPFCDVVLSSGAQIRRALVRLMLSGGIGIDPKTTSASIRVYSIQDIQSITATPSDEDQLLKDRSYIATILRQQRQAARSVHVSLEGETIECLIGTVSDDDVYLIPLNPRRAPRVVLLDDLVQSTVVLSQKRYVGQKSPLSQGYIPEHPSPLQRRIALALRTANASTFPKKIEGYDVTLEGHSLVISCEKKRATVSGESDGGITFFVEEFDDAGVLKLARRTSHPPDWLDHRIILRALNIMSSAPNTMANDGGDAPSSPPAPPPAARE